MQCGQPACTCVGFEIWNDISTDMKIMSSYAFTKQLVDKKTNN